MKSRSSIKFFRPIISFALLLFLFSSWTLNKRALSFDQSSSSGVLIDDDGLTVDGKLLSHDWKVTEFEDAFGKADTVFGSKFSATHIYNTKGISFFERQSTTSNTACVKEIMFWFGKDNESTWGHVPDHYCNQKLLLGDYNFSPTITPEGLRTKLKNWKECKTYSSHWYNFSTKEVFLYIAFEKTEQHVVWIDVGIRSGTSDCN